LNTYKHYTVFFSVIDRNVFEMTEKNYVSHCGQNVWKYRLMNTVTVSLIQLRQITEISQQKNDRNVLVKKSRYCICTYRFFLYLRLMLLYDLLSWFLDHLWRKQVFVKILKKMQYNVLSIPKNSLHTWAQLGRGHGGAPPPHFFRHLGYNMPCYPTFFCLGFVIYWFHTKLSLHILQKMVLMSAYVLS